MAAPWSSFCEKAANVLVRTLDGRQITLQQWCDMMARDVKDIKEILDNLPTNGGGNGNDDCEYTKKLIDIIYTILGLGD